MESASYCELGKDLYILPTRSYPGLSCSKNASGNLTKDGIITYWKSKASGQSLKEKPDSVIKERIRIITVNQKRFSPRPKPIGRVTGVLKNQFSKLGCYGSGASQNHMYGLEPSVVAHHLSMERQTQDCDDKSGKKVQFDDKHNRLVALNQKYQGGRSTPFPRRIRKVEDKKHIETSGGVLDSSWRPLSRCSAIGVGKLGGHMYSDNFGRSKLVLQIPSIWETDDPDDLDESYTLYSRSPNISSSGTIKGVPDPGNEGPPASHVEEALPREQSSLVSTTNKSTNTSRIRLVVYRRKSVTCIATTRFTIGLVHVILEFGPYVALSQYHECSWLVGWLIYVLDTKLVKLVSAR